MDLYDYILKAKKLIEQAQENRLPKVGILHYLGDGEIIGTGGKPPKNKPVSFEDGMRNASLIFMNQSTFDNLISILEKGGVSNPFEMATQDDIYESTKFSSPPSFDFKYDPFKHWL
jgi:hypothetical protein